MASGALHSDDRRALDFLAARLTLALDRSAELFARLEAQEADARRMEAAVARAMRNLRAGKAARALACVASLGPFEVCLVALPDKAGRLALAAQSRVLGLQKLGSHSALLASFRGRRIIVRNQLERAVCFEEDLQFRTQGFRSYICLPASQAVVCLVSTGSISAATRARLETFMQRISTHLALAAMEAEKKETERMFRELAFRMFAAVDNERARLAGELHDEVAQLLTAARIALGFSRSAVKGRKSTAMLVEAEMAIRRKIHDLKPATLGNRSLADVLAFQVERLKAAQVKAKLDLDNRALRMSPPLQNLFYSIVREGVSNLIAHARPASAGVSLRVQEGADSQIELLITHQGSARRFKPTQPSSLHGMGLGEIEKRVTLLGGQFSFDLSPSGSRLRAAVRWM